MEIKRDCYLNTLISKEHNGLIKVITGMRKCGKFYLLFALFKEHLLSEGVCKMDVYDEFIEEYNCRRQLYCVENIKLVAQSKGVR